MASSVILTGAGISRESGLATFRDPGGLWQRYRPEELATPEAFARDPALVQGWYNARRAALLDQAVRPNAAHLALARLERERPGEVLVVTQNVDDLHERAGSRSVIHMHGELLKIRCTRCGAISAQRGDVDAALPCPGCARPGGLRPHIVWFGEMPLEMARISTAIAGCALFVAIGTSGHVYPAAGFVREARGCGARTVELNLDPSQVANDFAERIYGPATEVVPAFVQRLLAGGEVAGAPA